MELVNAIYKLASRLFLARTLPTPNPRNAEKSANAMKKTQRPKTKALTRRRRNPAHGKPIPEMDDIRDALKLGAAFSDLLFGTSLLHQFNEKPPSPPTNPPQATGRQAGVISLHQKDDGSYGA